MSDIANLSAEELFELAKKKQAEEIEQKREAAKAEIDALRQKRRDLVAQHKKDLAKIDSELSSLTGRKASKSGARASRGSNISNIVLEILGSGGQMTTKDLQAALDNRGVPAPNLAQTLAYLKKKGSISSPARSVYQAA
ncbi:MAG: hypothetical protein ACO3SE_05620 [Sedimenticolaceae bacterium]